ncbi:hypothetical protein G6L37_04550 [Agrobacterium rubi]|nr:hypothetical protein [Agrobacterium rubi]NTF24623.1 hypothetical protein [Agrobacterium rubi]
MIDWNDIRDVSEIRELPAGLPMRYAPDLFTEEEDVAFDDGHVYFHGSVYDQRLEIHDLLTHDRDLRGARTGLGRKAMDAIRPHFQTIVACQVGEDTAPVPEQPAFLFWRRMLVDGLIDAISIGYGDCVITRDNVGEEIRSCYGTFNPSDGLIDKYASSP